MADEWIAFRAAVDLLGGYAPVLRALRLGEIRSQGRALDAAEHADISATQWCEWSFLPTYRGLVTQRRRAQGLLVPPGTEFYVIGPGFREIRLLRADVERLAASSPPSPPSPSLSPSSPPAATQVDLSEKESKLDATVAALRRLFPTGRKNHKVDALRAAVEKDLGYEVSPATIKRAMGDAWAVAQNGSK